MFRRLSIVLIACLCFVLTASAEDKASPAVKRILDKAVGKVRANRTEFDKANRKPLDEARVELQELSTKLINDGKTEEAGVVLKQVGTLETDVMRQANAPPPVAGAGGPQKPLLDRLVGKWRRVGHHHVITINADGSLQISNGDQGRVVVTAPEVVDVALKSGSRLRIPMAQEQFACALEWDPQGQARPGFVLERMR